MDTTDQYYVHDLDKDDRGDNWPTLQEALQDAEQSGCVRFEVIRWTQQVVLTAP